MQKKRFIIEAHFRHGLNSHEEKPYYYFGTSHRENLYTPDIRDARISLTERAAKKLLNEIKSRAFGNMLLSIKEIMVEK